MLCGYSQSAIPCYVHHVEFDSLSPEQLQGAIDTLQARHEVLRTRFFADGTQKIALSGDARVIVKSVDMRGKTQPEAEAYAANLAEDFPETALPPLEQGPPLAATLVRLPKGDRLLLVLRLIILDGPSLAQLFHDLLSCLQGQVLPSKPETLSYRDYVLGLVDQPKEQAQDYWAATLPKLPQAPSLPVTGRSPLQSKFKRLAGHLNPEKWSSLKTRAQQRGITPNAMMLAVYAAVLRPYSQDKNFVLNMLTNYRPFDHPELGSLVGNHSNMILTTCEQQDSFVVQANASGL